MRNKTRSPLKESPLRNPGQSVQARLDEVVDSVLMRALAAVFMVMIAALEWWRYIQPQPPQPLLVSIIAILVIGYAAFRVYRALPELRALRLARDGEKAVGQFLEHLRRDGHEVFHDILGAGFNVDHVVIGTKGIFTVETKTRSKPVKGNATVVFDGEQIAVNGFVPDRDPVRQAKAQAGWLRALLSSSTGKSFAVRPVVLFLGWFVEQKQGATREVWVLNEKAFPKFLANEANVLSAEDVKLVAFHLAQYIRASAETTSGSM